MTTSPILITGGSGFIGRKLAATIHEDFPVAVLDRRSTAQASTDRAMYIPCDLTSSENLRTALAAIREHWGSDIAAVVHLAADLDLQKDHEEANLTTQVEMAQRLMAELREFNVGQFVFSSTMLVHTPTRPGSRINESSPLGPRWMFPREKLAVERALRAEHGGIPLVILRLPNVYDDQCHSVALHQQIERIRGKRLTSRYYPGNPRHGQPYLHVDDLVDAIRRAIQRRAHLPSETTLLLGEPETVSYDALQRHIGWALHGKVWKTKRVSKRLAQTTLWLQYRVAELDPFLQPWMLSIADDHYELDVSRAAELLDWKPAHRLLETLPQILEHLRSDLESWSREHRLSA